MLSVLGSQGNAGQFRTPRNIIEFIVKILNPQKNETILDPACGTSGFLISSYKHILETNKNNLKPDERNQIIENIYGYDLDPEMVRMSLVNMYLHNFTDPKIYEYDTLTSDEKWDDYFDVILANPPFMTPKGGIRPHKRFSINSSRSEVLFIDYIIEHLKPNGRSGIIVPAGIIFDDEKPYVNIRKRLINEALVGIVSLPKGVFLPYSAVKTSILILDKKLSKERNDIFYINIENDGYSLNNSRKPIKENDLPIALENLYDNKVSKLSKKNILNNEKMSFVFTDYIKEKKSQNLKFKTEKISNLVEIFSGSREKGGSVEKGIPSIGGAQIGKHGEILRDKMVFVSENYFKKMKKGHLKKGDVLIVKDGATTGKIGLYKGEFLNAAINEHVYGLRTNNKISNKYLYYLMMGQTFQDKIKPMIQGIIGGINLKFSNLEIPLPSIEEQNNIVNELNSYEKIIQASQQIIQNYSPKVEIDINWDLLELGEVFQLSYGKGLKSDDRKDGIFNVYGSNGIVGKHNDFLVEGPFIIVGRKGSVGELHYSEENGFPIDTTFYISKKELKKEININLLFYLLKNIELKNLDDQSAVPGINRNNVYKMKINYPPENLHNEILQKVKNEEDILNKNKELIKIFQEKINRTVNRIWSF